MGFKAFCVAVCVVAMAYTHAVKVRSGLNAVAPAKHFASSSSDLCDKPADVIFVVDSSRHFREHKRSGSKYFFKTVASKFKISLDSIRIGMIAYSTYSYIAFNLEDFATIDKVTAAIDNLDYIGGDKRNTGDALERAHAMLTNTNTGARSFTEADKIIILLIEGTSVSKGLQEAIELLRNAMVRLYALGVGHKSDYDELQQMAAYPYYVHSFRLRNYAKLRSFSEDLADQVCKNMNIPYGRSRSRLNEAFLNKAHYTTRHGVEQN